MSTERAGLRRFALALAGVLAALGVLAGAGAAVSLTQGPRVSTVQVDPAAAISVSGARVILTANQALGEIRPEQITVTPEAPFTIDAAGRSVGVRFTLPLDDDTEYTVSVAGARAVGGGPVSELRTTFRTPPAEVLLLRRDAGGDDEIVRTDLAGRDEQVVFAAPVIDDFRTTPSRLVVVTSDAGVSTLQTMDRDGTDATEIALPGEGMVQQLQVSQRGDLVGYTFTDPSGEGLLSALFLSDLRDPAADPVPVELGGQPASVDPWRFVPDSTALLMVDFEGQLIQVDPQSGAEPVMLGGAVTIDAIARGSYTALIERADAGTVQLDLTTGEQSPLPQADADLGRVAAILPLPAGGAGRGGTIRVYQQTDADGLPLPPVVAHVADDGSVRQLLEPGPEDALLQTCVSPSGRYVAALVAPDIVANPYDDAPTAMPQRLETRIIDVATGEQLSALTGFAIDWCSVGPV